MKQKQLCNAISKIAWGYILLHVHINIGSFDILPDWLAYILFLQAIGVIAEEEASAKLLRPLAVALALWNGLSWLWGGVYSIEMIMNVLSLYFHFQFLTNLAGIACRYECKEEKRILSLRTARTILSTIMAMPFLWEKYEIVTYILLAIGLVVVFWICKVLFSFQNSLKELIAEEEQSEVIV